jgi:hypothetical protein
MGSMDVGMSTANGLYQQASSGTFRLEADAARRCADVYTRFVETTVDPQLQVARDMHIASGFGGFDSAQDLQKGFAGKATEMVTALQSVKEAALQMAAAYLRAGQLLEEADTMHARAIASVGERK